MTDPLPFNRRTVLLHTAFRHAVVTVYTFVRQPRTTVFDALDHVPVVITDTHLSVSLHHFPVSPTFPDTYEFINASYRRVWIPRTAEMWRVQGATAQMTSMMDFPPQLDYDTLGVRAYGLWMGDALIATGYLPEDTIVNRGEILQIAFRLNFGAPAHMPVIVQ